MAEQTPPEAEATGSTAPVGSVWVLKTKAPVFVTRPDESISQVVPADGVALYVLDVPGDFEAALNDRTGRTLKVTAV